MTDQEILDNAPEGATHFDDEKNYLKCDVNYEWRCFSYKREWIFVDCNPFGDYTNIRSLADIKRIAELEQENKDLDESLTIAYMQGYSDGKAKLKEQDK